MAQIKNVLGTNLEPCCHNPLTGFYRDGYCNTGEEDLGSHTICVQMTQEFLEFSKFKGNDLSTPNLVFGFPGLQPGDFWCLCSLRWKEAYEEGVAPRVKLASTHEQALEVIDLETLKRHAINVIPSG